MNWPNIDIVRYEKKSVDADFVGERERKMEVSDDEKQKMLDQMVSGELEVQSLDKAHFLGLLDALARMFTARVFNCCDASGKKDKEWLTLSEVFVRVMKELAYKR